MYANFDFKCPHCGHREERFVRKSEMDKQTCQECFDPILHTAPVCLMRMPSAPATTFRFADEKLK